jgi:hypothetical protein
MKNSQEEAIRRKLESLSDKERADLSAKINNVMYGEQEQSDSNSSLEVPAMLADPSIPDRYKLGGRLNEAFLDGVEYAERILTNQAKEQNGWHSVTDELPTTNEEVLAEVEFDCGYGLCHDYGIAHFDPCGNQWYTREKQAINVTRWMPIPEPPHK